MILQAFDFQDAAVRVMQQAGEPWFVAADVCRVLDIANSRDAVSGLDEDEKATVANADSRPGQPGAKSFQIISESGLYALVFKSRKPEAKVFRKWVTSEVLPAIRRTGGYSFPMGGGEALPMDVVSVLSFVRESCVGWPLERQMAYGLMVRRYAKSMGVVFQTLEEPGVGRVFAFGRPLLEAVRGTMVPKQAALADTEAQELASLIRCLHDEHGDAMMPTDEVRRAAVKMGLFPQLLKLRSESARNSAFGVLIARYAGHLFPNGYLIESRRSASRRFYEIRREEPKTPLASA